MIEIIEEEKNIITMENIGEKLRRLRISKGWTFAEMGRQAGLAPATITKTEDGRIPNAYTLIQMADALGYEIILREKR